MSDAEHRHVPDIPPPLWSLGTWLRCLQCIWFPSLCGEKT